MPFIPLMGYRQIEVTILFIASIYKVSSGWTTIFKVYFMSNVLMSKYAGVGREGKGLSIFSFFTVWVQFSDQCSRTT